MVRALVGIEKKTMSSLEQTTKPTCNPSQVQFAAFGLRRVIYVERSSLSALDGLYLGYEDLPRSKNSAGQKPHAALNSSTPTVVPLSYTHWVAAAAAAIHDTGSVR